jgi:FlaG/FlaF family flagellin (archaellin)
MGIGTWHRVAIAGLLAGALASCAHERRTAKAQQPTEAQRTQQAFQEAAKGQEQLAGAQKRLDAARQDVARAQQQLAAAQQREARERENVQQLGIKARQDLERANALAQQQQLAAEQAQGLSSAAGRITEATPSRVVLHAQDGRTMSFHLDQRTRVLVGSEQRSISAVQQGADARVTYDPAGPEPTALTIRVTPVTPGGRDAGQAPAPVTPPPEPPRSR